MNTEALVDQNQQFDFYDGGGLDQAYLGMAQVDAVGNVNVSRFGSTSRRLRRVHQHQPERKVVFVGTFTAGAQLADRRRAAAHPRRRGRTQVRPAARADTFNASRRSSRCGHETLYVTERGVFRLRETGSSSTEVAPGVDLENEVLAQMEFRPAD